MALKCLSRDRSDIVAFWTLFEMFWVPHKWVGNLDALKTVSDARLTDCLPHLAASIDVVTQMVDFRLRPIDQE
jgi:hypothetical protein